MQLVLDTMVPPLRAGVNALVHDRFRTVTATLLAVFLEKKRIQLKGVFIVAHNYNTHAVEVVGHEEKDVVCKNLGTDPVVV